MTYYLKYRPQKLEELDQTSVRNSLQEIVKSGKVPHAFLFSGPKGTGKTSAARILAKIVNCSKPKGIDPCNTCSECVSITKGQSLDVIELDAASHRGIDDVRSLRDAVKLAPARSNKKVYIIDEAHMLTTEASNALLKTLEEPPDHVMFILATTNPEKLIDTIRSRVTNIIFKKATKDEIVSSLTKIAKGEGIKADKDVLEEIASASDGSFRDASKIFEQVVTEVKELKPAEVSAFLSKRKSFSVAEFLGKLSEKSTKEALNMLADSMEKGASAKDVGFSIVEALRNQLLSKVGVTDADGGQFQKNDLITLIKLFSETSSKIFAAYIESMPLEIAIIEWCEGGPEKAGVKIKSEKTEEEVEIKTETVKSTNGNSENIKVEKNGQKEESGVQSEENKLSDGDGITDDVWNQILSKIKPGHTSTEALLRAAKPLEFNGSVLKLGVYYKFHKEHLEGTPHRAVLEEVLSEHLGGSVRVICTLTEPPAARTEGVTLREPENNVPNLNSPLTGDGGNDIINIAEKIFGN